MLKRISIFYCLHLLLFFLPEVTNAQKQLLDFDHITGTDGVSIGKLSGITQDKLGYMWMVDQSCNCLVRYDGYRTKTFKYTNGDKYSPGGLLGECVVTDPEGSIWFNHSKGIDKYNVDTKEFLHFTYPIDLPVVGISAMLIDHSGIVWIGTNNGLDRLDPKTKKFTRYNNKINDASSLSCNMVRSLYEDKQGILWVGTGWPFGNFAVQNGEEKCGGLNKFNRDNGTFTRYLHDPSNPQSIINNKVRAIFEDSRGTFWVGTQGDGLQIMDRKTGTFQHLTYDATHPEKLSRPPIKKFDEWDHITFINEDGAGAIWIGTFSQGLVRYNPATKEITHYCGETTRLNGFTDSSSWCAYRSREGALWIATESSNLFRVNSLQTNIKNVSLNENGAWCFYEDKKGTLWAGLFNNEGLARIDRSSSGSTNIKILRLPVNDAWTRSVNYISAAGEKLLLATWYGLFTFDPRTEVFTHITLRTRRKADWDRLLFVNNYNDGNLYLSGKGFYVMNLKDSSITEYYKDQNDSTSISSDTTITLFKERSNFWIGTREQGLNFFDSQTKKFKHFLPGLSVYSIYKDKKGNLWVGTSTGLYLRDSSTQNFIHYLQETEFGKSIITGIIEDDAGNIWGTSSIGIFRINLEKNEFCLYGRKFGISQLPSNHKMTPFKLPNGDLIFGNFSGYYTFNPAQLINQTPPNILFTALRLDGKPVPDNNNSFYKGTVETAETIHLHYNQNIFSIDFAGIHFSDPENNIFHYKLEPYENTWRNVGTEKTAYYFNIPPGHYTFKLKVASSYGVESEKAINVIVSPPWWSTWWFRIAAIVFLVSAFYFILRWRLKEKFKLQLERSEKEKQLAELKQKGTEMEMQALRAQMNPHFIFNSLNSINRFILQNNKAQASEYLTKFSRLVRMILQNSQASLITLESELESLELYLNLEALRFNYHFDYKINIPKDLDISALQVPPLILQPYVENAIWHGLMHKEEKGQLNVDVSEEGNYLYFKIIDNGIGREKAASLASKSATKHKSMGLRITAHRIAILQNSETNTSPVTINDLVNPDGSAAGTEVVIKMPVIYD